MRILIISGCVLKQCYFHNNMDTDCKQQCIYVHRILDFKLILLLLKIYFNRNNNNVGHMHCCFEAAPYIYSEF